MTHNTDWDIDYYKTDYESDEHWDLRRAFMLKHKASFPEEELVCLAQVFTNVEFMGCRYPEETMRRVGLLSQEVAAEFRASRAGKLKRTFVGAQDAAGAKAKAPDYTKPVKFVSASATAASSDSTKPTDTESPSTSATAAADAPSQPKRTKPNAFAGESTHTPDPPNQMNRTRRQLQPKVRLQTQKRLPLRAAFDGFILYDATTGDKPNANVMLQMSASKQKRKLVTKTVKDANGAKKSTCTVSLDDVNLAVATADTNQEASVLACEHAVRVLQKQCFTIRMKKPDQQTDDAALVAAAADTKQRITTEAGRAGSDAQLVASANDNYAANRLTSNNVGFKMLQQLGWSGGGLGNADTGRGEPVAIEMQLNRAGLGLEVASAANEQLNYRYLSACLRDYVQDVDNIHELVFAEDFTKEERAQLHRMAAKQALQSKSKNTAAGGRYLVLSKKIGLHQLATDVYNGGMYASRFVLEPPMSAK